ncbi:helix-turn-helix transcriptional regulator [Bacillaceae bacterium SIJ1]|uniref:helix-turn-helix domain-containing protein n=1 Tax=Litoribacterium kuwaitense TaxID=1398745 RepID=UPI0013ED81E9|nr:AraC family transcriptional regulator [Litoribacterium kuwaitense]NGP45776.1 helix-turn-helix transcriptional regulator [Litoribacterium kuwaitense]
MNHSSQDIDEVIAYIHDYINEPLPLTRLARYAAYSPYHFSRLFKQKTGLSPHYYVSSLKLQRAKDLLLTTDLTVRDIGMEIGQQSLGTFTTRFTEKVGMTPAQFRKSPVKVSGYLQSLKQLPHWSQQSHVDCQWNKVEGTIEAESSFRGVILIGLFTKPIPEGLPQYGTLLSSLGRFAFNDVRPGVYYLMATALFWEMAATDILVPHQTLRVKAEQPIRVGTKLAVPYQRLKLRGPRLDDPPILISLPILMKKFLIRLT